MSVTVKPTDDPSKYHVGAGRACTLPNRVNDRPVRHGPRLCRA